MSDTNRPESVDIKGIPSAADMGEYLSDDPLTMALQIIRNMQSQRVILEERLHSMADEIRTLIAHNQALAGDLQSARRDVLTLREENDRLRQVGIRSVLTADEWGK